MAGLSQKNKDLLLMFLLHQLASVSLPESVLADLTGWDDKTVSGTVKSLQSLGYIKKSESGISCAGTPDFTGNVELLLNVLNSDEAAGMPTPLFSCLSHNLYNASFEVLQDLVDLARHCTRTPNYRTLLYICKWLLRKMLDFKPADHSIVFWRRFVELCQEAHPFTLPYYELGRQTVLVLYKARGLAYAMGDMRSLASLDIIIGSETTRQFYSPNRSRLSQAGQRGKNAMAALSDWEMQTRLSLYLGIIDFDQGYYQNAIGHLSLCQHFDSSHEQNILMEISQLYHGQAACLLGNFSLGTSILRSALRLSSMNNSTTTRDMLKMHLCALLLAQGHLDEPLELIDGAIACVSPATDPELWSCCCAVLAYYHRMSGHLDKAYLIFSRCIIQTGGKHFSYFLYHMPFFMELLYVWDEAGFPPIPGCEFETELKSRLGGHNKMLRAVAMRLQGQILQRSKKNKDIQSAIHMLEQSLSIAREIGVARERAKICVMLAKIYMVDNRKQAAQALAMEAWSLSHMLRQDPWIQILASMVPAPHSTGETEDSLTPEDFYDQLSISLMEDTPENIHDFYAVTVKKVCKLFGAERACLLRAHESSNYFLVLSKLNIGEEEINSKSFLSRSALVEKALAGSPVFTAVSCESIGKGESLAVICIPIQSKDLEHIVLYMDGDIFPQLANILTQETILNISRILAWEFIRFERGRGSRGKRETLTVKTDENAYAIIYKSEVMRSFLEQTDHAARSDAAITIYGETGTGKELIARRIHAVSGRKGPFVAVNLSSMPEDLFENEMFGHERGAFTGALHRRSGLVELADRGTLFIDEMPDISQRVQIKLLRLLQEKTFSRLGATNLIHSDFRLIVATNRDIKKDVLEGRFREDLFYRICVIPLTVPPLRERADDIQPILEYYLEQFSRRYQKHLKMPLTPEDIARMRTHCWPGNVRELRNLAEQAVIQARNDEPLFTLPSPIIEQDTSRLSAEVSAQHVGIEGVRQALQKNEDPFFFVARPQPKAGESASDMMDNYFEQLPNLHEVEQNYIKAVLRLTGGKIDGNLGAAKILGLKRSSLYYRLDKMRRAGIIPDNSSFWTN